MKILLEVANEFVIFNNVNIESTLECSGCPGCYHLKPFLMKIFRDRSTSEVVVKRVVAICNTVSQCSCVKNFCVEIGFVRKINDLPGYQGGIIDDFTDRIRDIGYFIRPADQRDVYIALLKEVLE